MEALNRDPNVITGTVRYNVAVALRFEKYRQLADYLKTPILLAWARLQRGRTIRVVRQGETALFLMTMIAEAKEVGCILDENELAEALAEVGVGNIISDPYELRLVVRLADKFGVSVK